MRLNTPIKVRRPSKSAGDRYGRGQAAALADVAGLEEVWAQATPKQGGETSLGLRMESRQPWELVVRRDPVTSTITAADVIETLDDLALRLNVRAVAPLQTDPNFLLITAEQGGPGG